MKRIDVTRRKLIIQGLHGAALLGAPAVADASLLVRGDGAQTQQSTGIEAAGLLNVKDYGAAGDGARDDTAALLAAIAALPSYSATHNGIANIIYFPVGTYKISDTIERIGEVVGTSNGKLANLILLGADRDTTIIELADSAPGFTNSRLPKSMIAMHSGDYYFQSPGDGEGNEAFNNTVENLTVSVGTGNVGARAIDWVVNNYGVIRNVKVLAPDPASCGIYMVRREVGPGLISNVTIDGPFDVGVDLAYSELSVTMEHIAITGTTSVGLRNSQNVCCLRNVTITTTDGIGVQQIEGGAEVAAPWGPNEGLIVWQDGIITGNGTTAYSGNSGYFNFSNVHVKTFNGRTNQTLDGVWAKTVKIANPDWQLTVKDTPSLPGLPDTSWGRIVAPLAPADATSAIQLALNRATASQLFLPNGVYYVRGAITIPDTVTCIDFLYSNFQLTVGTPYDLFKTNATRTADLFLKRLIIENAGTGISAVVHHFAPPPSRLIITDFAGPNLVTRDATAGEVYVENCNSAHFVVNGGGAGIWMRQFNPEGGTTKVYNVTAPMWVLGLKTESPSIAIDNDGGNVEVLGGLHLAGSAAGSIPKFKNYNGGRISAAYVNEDLAPRIGYTTEIVSVINGVSDTILSTTYPQRGAHNGRVVYKISTDDFIPNISFTAPLIRPSAEIGTSVATAFLAGYNYKGTPVWFLSDHANGKYAINSSTGAVTVAAALSPGIDYVTIAVTGVTPRGVVSKSVAVYITTANSVSALDVAKRSRNIKLSSSNLTATLIDNVLSGGSIVGGDTGHTTGKKYFEATLTVQGGSSGADGIGLAASTMPYDSDNSFGLAGTPSVYTSGTGSVLYNGTIIAPASGVGFWTAGERMDIAVDFDSRLLWRRIGNGNWNGSWTADPGTGIGGVDIHLPMLTGALFPGVEVDAITSSVTLNFGATSFAGRPPAGFGYW